MNDQYYRKVRPKYAGWLKKALRKKSVVITLIVVLPALSFILFSNRGIFQRMSLESDRREMLKKIQEAQHEQQRLLQESKALDSDQKAIEKVAREKYGMVKEGETVYKVKKDSD